MPSEISLKDPTVLTSQAALHRGAAEHMYETISLHEGYHDALVTATQVTVPIDPELQELRTMGPSYTSWWETFRPHLFAYGDSHQALANHVDGAVINYNAVDAHAVLVFSGGTQPG
jgi:hypothetical protein